MTSPTRPDRRAERRDAQRAQNRTEILDAAERVFGEHGMQGSIRQIADLAGFSSAAIYLFFENKDDLVTAVLQRRGDELVPAITQAASAEGQPLEKLHAIVDLSTVFFAERPHFRQMLRHLVGGVPLVGPKAPGLSNSVEDRFAQALTALVDLVREGQDKGQVRAGDPNVLAYFYMVLVNEFVLLATAELATTTFSSEEFHLLLDGALRATPERSHQ